MLKNTYLDHSRDLKNIYFQLDKAKHNNKQLIKNSKN